MICKKCKVDGNFKWDQQHNENTGQWRLFDNDKERPHECVIKKSAKPKPKKKEKTLCPKCDPQTRKPIDADKLQEHIKKNHIDWGNFDD